jgi:hypothetical protein
VNDSPSEDELTLPDPAALTADCEVLVGRHLATFLRMAGTT